MHFQGLTKQQARAIQGTLMDELEWDDKRLQGKYDECASVADAEDGDKQSAEGQQQQQQQQDDNSSEDDSELSSEEEEGEQGDEGDEWAGDSEEECFDADADAEDAQAEGRLKRFATKQLRASVAAATGWDLSCSTGEKMHQLFNQAWAELHLQFWDTGSQEDEEEQQQQQQQPDEAGAAGAGSNGQNNKQQAASADEAAAAPRRQQRKAAAGARQAVLAVLGNSQSLSAAAVTDKAGIDVDGMKQQLGSTCKWAH
ncbi:hypothetical protein COO60DRAFT_1698060 [Scenedesmus sp. NREL 46B-D3]|nr:hypothetical protein COO60DRAFT_1698060 [Scenedesmus sp. NREL 46B-D3]